MPVCGEQRAGRPTTEGETMTTEPRTRTPEEIEAAIEANAGHMHDAWLDAYNKLAELARRNRRGGMIYLYSHDAGAIDAIIEAGAVAMACNDKLEDQLTALQNEEG